MTIIQRILSIPYDYHNPYAYAIKQIIDQGLDYSEYDNPTLVQQCDLLFVDRWRRNRIAYRPSFWTRHFEVSNLIREGILDDGIILDFACGTGNIAIELARYGYEVVGIDLSPKAIAIANLYKEHLPNRVKERVSFYRDDITTFHSESLFTVCIMLHVLEHISNPGFIFSSLNRLMMRNGKIWVSVPLGNYHDDPTHVHHFYSADEFKTFLESFASVEYVKTDDANKVISALLVL